jgi:hypothetical protein
MARAKCFQLLICDDIVLKLCVEDGIAGEGKTKNRPSDCEITHVEALLINQGGKSVGVSQFPT